MSTPNDPQDPYRPAGEPAQPTEGGVPQYPAAPQQPAVPQYGQYAPPPEGQPAYPTYPAATPYPTAPQYGAAPAYGAAMGYPKNSLAVWSLVLAIVGFFVCGFFTGIPAVIVGGRAKRAVAEGQANNGGMATAGVVLGWIVIVISVLGIIASIFLIANAGSWSEFVDEYSSTTSS